MSIRSHVAVLAVVIPQAAFFAHAADKSADAPPLVIEKDTQLDPAKTYGRIVIKGSNITIDGKGASIIGASDGDPKTFHGTVISAEEVSGVTLKNVTVKGWETGLTVKDGEKWTIESCDFSGNFHDPKFGWGENGRRGGIVLNGVKKSKLLKNQAHNVWDACVLVDCEENMLEGNDFSHTSNTCLKMWNSSDNIVQDNVLSHGIRKDPGEVHARDSTSVLIESGSNRNRFLRNDCTHGGDGIFIRVLNNWVSTDNYFEGNDCSYANNNCIEAWSPRNTWVRNKANHGSYGFWLGASDQNVLNGNEASFNGLAEGNHNSPHLPDNGHAGIVFMFGPSSHTILRHNKCEGNNGAGIAGIGDIDSKGKKWKAYHWIIEQNQLSKNRWGIYLEHADFIDIAANRFDGNTSEDIHEGENVTRLEKRGPMPDITLHPQARMAMRQNIMGAKKRTVFAGEQVFFDSFDSSASTGLRAWPRWDFDRASKSSNANGTSMTFPEAGFYRVSLTVDNGLLSDLAWRDLYVVERISEVGTDQSTNGWSWSDSGSKVNFELDTKNKLLGESSLLAKISPYSGGRVTLVHKLPKDGVSLAGKKQLVFWLKTRNENVPAWQDLNPLLTLCGDGEEKMTLTPIKDFLSQPPYNEAREGWTYFAVPLAGSEDWKKEGELPVTLRAIEIGFDSWGAPPLFIWMDGMGVK
ncbi:MAG: right-handed parallel beta-helix repeat-containing protein [Pirellulaceae bacterium]|nr:right-handed parallel beta-helix repeat-containing protein [Pirellulaceae bacterium]